MSKTRPEIWQSTMLRRLEPRDRSAWERLWTENLAHFGASATARPSIPIIWDRLLDESEPLLGCLIETEDQPAGLIHVVLRQHTFSAAIVGILEDLWVAPWARGRGLSGRAIELLAGEGRAFGWRRLEWETDADNMPAQTVYERLARQVPVRRYQIELT